MNNLIIDFSGYLKMDLDYDVKHITDREYSYPAYITGNYHLEYMLIGNNEYVIMVPDQNKGITPSQLQKHITRVIEITGIPVIILERTINAYIRARYIEKKIPFVMPYNQMYLPQIGIDLREYYLKKKNHNKKLTPASQTILLALIYKKIDGPVNAKRLSRVLNYTPMTMGRGINVLHTMGLIDIENNGKSKWISLRKYPPDPDTMTQLINPMAQTFFSSALPQNSLYVKSGLTTLSHYSNLTDSDYTTIAIDKKFFNNVKASGILSDSHLFDNQKFKIEFWEYNPMLFSKDEYADILSVYASVKEEYSDARILQAAEEMIQGMKW